MSHLYIWYINFIVLDKIYLKNNKQRLKNKADISDLDHMSQIGQ